MSARKENILYINGQFFCEKEARISPFDHGLLYGDGVFDAVRVCNQFIFKLDQHLDRFYRSAKIVGLVVPLTKESLKAAVVEVAKRNAFKDAYIRIVVTVGVGAGVGGRRTVKPPPTVLILEVEEQIHPLDFSKSFKEGRKAIIAVTRSIPPMCGPESRAKHNNYLNHTMADMEALRAGVDFAIALDINGFVTECQGGNIFVVKQGVIETPPPYVGILEGITRQTIVEIARDEGIQVAETMLTPYDIYTADEVFASSTAGGVISITEVDSKSIGEGSPGPVANRLQKRYQEMLQKGLHGTKVLFEED